MSSQTNRAIAVRARNRERLGTGLVIGGFVVLVLVAYAYPLLNLVNVSLKTSPEFMLDPIGLTSSFHFQNYVNVVVNNDFVRNFVNSLYYLAASNLLTLSMTSLAAFVISRRYVRFAGFFYVLFLAGIFLPDPLIPQFYLLNTIGLYNNPIGYILLKANPGIVMLLMVGYYRTRARRVRDLPLPLYLHCTDEQADLRERLDSLLRGGLERHNRDDSLSHEPEILSGNPSPVLVRRAVRNRLAAARGSGVYRGCPPHRTVPLLPEVHHQQHRLGRYEGVTVSPHVGYYRRTPCS